MAANFFVSEDQIERWLDQAGDPNQWMICRTRSVRFIKSAVRKDQLVGVRERYGKISKIVHVLNGKALEINGLKTLLNNINQ